MDTTKLDGYTVPVLDMVNTTPTCSLPVQDETDVQDMELEDAFFDGMTEEEIDGQVINKPVSLIQPASMIEESEIQWLLKNWIAEGCLHSIFGQEKTKKSWLATYIIATLSSGRPWFNGDENVKEGINCMYIPMEDSIPGTVIKRLKMLDANMDKVFLFNEIVDNTITLPATTKMRNFSLDLDMRFLEEQIVANNIGLLIIDTLERTVEQYENNPKMQKIMLALKKLAENTGCAIVMLGHFKKGTYKPENIRSMFGGAHCIPAICRIVMTVMLDPTKEGVSNLAQYGNNLSDKLQDTLSYKLARTANGKTFFTFDVDNEPNNTSVALLGQDTTDGVQKQIAQYLYLENKACTPLEIAQAKNIPFSTVRGTLRRMVINNRVECVGYGVYNIPVNIRAILDEKFKRNITVNAIPEHIQK